MSENAMFERGENKKELARQRIENGLRVIMRGKIEMEVDEAKIKEAANIIENTEGEEIKAEMQRIIESLTFQINRTKNEIYKIAQEVVNIAKELNIEINLDEILELEQGAQEQRDAA